MWPGRLDGRAMAAGYSLVEITFVAGLIATLAAVAVPQTLASIDDLRTSAAARYLSLRLQRARMEAIARSSEVAIQISLTAGGYAYATYVDGNGNGVRTSDIRQGVDRQIAPPERLPDNFSGVDFGALPNLPAVDSGGTPPGADPIRLGGADIASFSPNGTSSSGSLYVIGGRNAQYVVRLYGQTGKTRVLRFDPGAKQWKPL
jgi:type II secretory pathway pseudopilin PulG